VKQYSSQLRAVDGIDLEVGEGEVFGLIGPNGAGKSTTIRIVATILSPTAGTVKVLGHDVVKEQQEVRKIISYLPEEAGAYDNLSGEEYLRFMARFYGGDVEAALQRGIRIADLGDRIKSKTKEYSKGMKRRLLIGRTLMTDSRLFIMDEPTGGLDIVHAHHIRNMIKDRVKRTRTSALVSSHNLLEVEFLCDRVAIIDHGKIATVGTPAELKKRFSAANLEDVFLQIVRDRDTPVKATSSEPDHFDGASSRSSPERPGLQPAEDGKAANFVRRHPPRRVEESQTAKGAP
jgi:ABC-2 type transport system ATP-binding protein